MRFNVWPDGHRLVLPGAELHALADAIDKHVIVATKETVVRFLRSVHRSPIQPSLGFRAPMWQRLRYAQFRQQPR